MSSLLSIPRLVEFAVDDLIDHWQLVVKLSAVVIPAAAAVSYVAAVWAPDVFGESAATKTLRLINLCTTAAACTVVAVGWHRLVLLSETDISFLPSWSRLYTKFFFISFSLDMLRRTIALVAARASDGDAPSLAGVLGFVFSAYLLACLSLSLPAAATGQPNVLRRAWEISLPDGARIASACLVPGLLLGILLWFQEMSTGIRLDSNASWISSPIAVLEIWALVPFLIAFEASVLSRAYRETSPLA